MADLVIPNVAYVRVVHPWVAGLSLIAMVVEHRRHCPGESCVVSLGLLRPIYESLIGRVCTDQEAALFV